MSAFRAGDTVHHGPSDEDWILAADQRGDYVMWCGWPVGTALASDCTLVEAATDGERLAMLRDVAMSRRDDGTADARTIWAQEQLAQEPRR